MDSRIFEIGFPVRLQDIVTCHGRDNIECLFDSRQPSFSHVDSGMIQLMLQHQDTFLVLAFLFLFDPTSKVSINRLPIKGMLVEQLQCMNVANLRTEGFNDPPPGAGMSQSFYTYE